MSLIVDYTSGTTLVSGSTAPSVHSHNVRDGVNVAESWRYGILKSRIDTTLAGTLTTGDVFHAITIPIYTIVLRVWIQTITPETVAGPLTGTLIIGDQTVTNGFMATPTAPSATAGGVISALAADAGASNVICGKFFPAADTIVLTNATHEFSLLVMDVYALVIDTAAK